MSEPWEPRGDCGDRLVRPMFSNKARPGELGRGRLSLASDRNQPAVRLKPVTERTIQASRKNPVAMRIMAAPVETLKKKEA